MPMNRFESRRYKWTDYADPTKIGLLCDALDDLEVDVKEQIAECLNQVNTVRRQQWAIIALLIGTLLSIIGGLVVAR